MDKRDSPMTRISTALVQRAARRAPAELRERLGEEWLADLAEQRGDLRRLRFALGCCWARQVITRDPLWSRAPARSVAPGIAMAHETMAALAAPAPAPSPLSRRTLVLFAIVGLHVAAIFAFVYGVSATPRVFDPGPIKGRLIPQAAPTQPPPPVVKGKLEKVFVVKPLGATTSTVPPVFVDPEDTVAITPTHDAALTPRVNRLPGGPGAGFPSPDDFYPAGAIRLEETGIAAVQVCVDARGRLSADPVIAVTSGSARLDGGALALARAGSGHYRSATEDGRPVAACFPLRVRFTLRQ